MNGNVELKNDPPSIADNFFQLTIYLTTMSVKETPSKTIGHYAIGKTIGEGTFGKVKLGTHILTGEKVAVKILEKDKIKEQADLERVAREINILKSMRHPHIIQLYEIVETTRSLYLIMEYADGGELFDHIVKLNKVKDRDAAAFILQILSGVDYIHQHKVTHRDLKPENLLLDSQKKTLKIVDFGLSNYYTAGGTLKTACGSPCYAAPEMIAGKRYIGLQVDIWSCGVILYAMLCGYLPFEDPVTSNLYKKIIAGDFVIPKYISAPAKDLIKGILNTDPVQRFTIQQILEHPWMTSSLQCNKLMLTDGFHVGRDSQIIEEDLLELLATYNFNVEYAKQCLENNRHNHLTTTFYLLKQKSQRTSGELTTSRKRIPEEQVLDQKVSQFLSEKDQPQNLPPPIDTDIDLKKSAKQIIDKISNPITPVYEINLTKTESTSAEREPEIRPARSNNYYKTKTRNVSLSVEKKPENLFPTSHQIAENANRFKSKALQQSYHNDTQYDSDTSCDLRAGARQQSTHEKPYEKKQPLEQNNRQKSPISSEKPLRSPSKQTHVSSRIQSPREVSTTNNSLVSQRRIQSTSPGSGTFGRPVNIPGKCIQPIAQMRKIKGPYHLSQVVAKPISQIMNLLFQFMNLNKFTILNASKLEITAERDLLQFEVSLWMIPNADCIFVVKMNRLAGQEVEYNDTFELILRYLNL